jgi:hypothetical protein
MLELRWAEKGDKGFHNVIRLPKKHLDLAVHLYRYLVETKRAYYPVGQVCPAIDLFEVRGGATIAHYSVDDFGHQRVDRLRPRSMMHA